MDLGYNYRVPMISPGGSANKWEHIQQRAMENHTLTFTGYGTSKTRWAKTKGFATEMIRVRPQL